MPKFTEIYDKKITNISNYKNNLLQEYESVDIKYINDKYMFIIVKDKNSKNEELVIEKTDKLF